MSSQHRQPGLIGEWLDETYEAERDPGRFLYEALEAIPSTPQRRRGWWHHFRSRRNETVSASDTIDYQPSPVPATNGHSPTVIGRTTSMLSPVEAITFGVLVVAVGSSFLITQPFDQRQGSAPGAEGGDERAAPVEFTGTWTFGDVLVPESSEPIGLVTRRTGGAWQHGAIDVSDPRFDGEVTVFANSDTYPRSGYGVWSAAWRVENDDGAWRSDPAYGVDLPDGSTTVRYTHFRGEGAYEGLVALVQMTLDGDVWSLDGVIVDGDLPPEPEPTTLD